MNDEPKKEIAPEILKLRDELIKAVDAGANEEQLAEQFNMTQREAREFSIKRRYDKGVGSIQDYARIYRISVGEVLKILAQPEMDFVETIGDLIDQEEAGVNAKVNSQGEKYRIPYNLD